MGESTGKSGRPRSEAARAAVLSAAFALLRERGYAGMAVEAVADRAGVGKATIYRWWPTRQELAVDAFFTATAAELAFADTPSAADDFRHQIHALADLLRGETGEAMAAMIAAARTDAVLRRALGERWVLPRKRWGQARMGRAVADGQCVDGLDVEAALDVLYGPVYTRLLFGLGIPSADRVEAVLRVAYAGIFRPKRRRRTR